MVAKSHNFEKNLMDYYVIHSGWSLISVTAQIFCFKMSSQFFNFLATKTNIFWDLVILIIWQLFFVGL